MAGAALLLWLADRYTRKLGQSEYALIAVWAGTELVIAVSVAVAGGPRTALLSWLAIPVVTLASRFSSRGILAGVTLSLVLLVGAALATDAARRGR